MHLTFDYLRTDQANVLAALSDANVAVERRERLRPLITELTRTAWDISRLLGEMAELTPYLGDRELRSRAHFALGILARRVRGCVRRAVRVVESVADANAAVTVVGAAFADSERTELQGHERRLASLLGSLLRVWRRIEIGSERIEAAFTLDVVQPLDLTVDLALAERFWRRQALRMQKDHRALASGGR